MNSSRLAPLPRSFRPPLRQPRSLTATTHVQRNLWQRNQPIVFASQQQHRDYWGGARRRDAGLAFAEQMTKERASEEVEDTASENSTSTPDQSPGRTTKLKEDKVIRLRQTFEQSIPALQELNNDLEKLFKDRKTRTRAEITAASDLLLDILDQLESVHKLAGKTSNKLCEKLSKLVSEDIAETVSIGRQTAPPSPDPWTTDEDSAGEGSPNSRVAVEFEHSISSIIEEKEFESEVEEPEESDLEPEVPIMPTSNHEPNYKPLERFNTTAAKIAARQAVSANSPQRFWSHTLYNDAEGKNVECIYATTIEDSEKHLQQFLNDPVIGFDMEWVYPEKDATSMRQNVALIQIANESTVLMMHIARMGLSPNDPLPPQSEDTVEKLLPPTLRKIIESPDILKTNVNSVGDHRRLHRFFKVEPKGVFELSDMYNLVKATLEGQGKPPKRALRALSKLSNEYLGLPLDKGDVRISNWSRHCTADQVHYAANDAYAGLRIFDILYRQWQTLSPRPAFPSPRNIHEYANTTSTYTTTSGRRYVVNDRLTVSKTTPTTSGTVTVSYSVSETETTNRDPESIDGIPNPGSESSPESETQAPRKPTPWPTSWTLPPSAMDPHATAKNITENWLSTYPNPHKLTNSIVRAYALWHVGGLEVPEICSFWEIKEMTAAGYILKATKQEGVEFDEKRLQDVMKFIPPGLQERWFGVPRMMGRKGNEI
ncbi:ribonuclease H-like domain-containing protein [Pyronema omphalodes]|nr:ribonuclease H-like domain-containing protein [Pyronema omphalodes]